MRKRTFPHTTLPVSAPLYAINPQKVGFPYHPHILDFTILLIGLFIVGPGRFISGARYDDLFEGRETFNIEFLSTTGLSLSPTTFDPFNTDKSLGRKGAAPPAKKQHHTGNAKDCGGGGG